MARAAGSAKLYKAWPAGHTRAPQDRWAVGDCARSHVAGGGVAPGARDLLVRFFLGATGSASVFIERRLVPSSLNQAFQHFKPSAMSATRPHRKLIKHFHEPGDSHELAFSCYQRQPLLTNDVWREQLAHCIDAAIDYIHMNLVRHGILKRAVDWRWSSAGSEDHAQQRSRRTQQRWVQRSSQVRT